MDDFCPDATGCRPAIDGSEPGPQLGTLPELVAFHAARQPSAPAMRALTGEEISYGALASQLAESRTSLRRLGIGPQDRVAVLMPDGPLAAACMLALVSSAVFSPVNPQTPEPAAIDMVRRLAPAAIAVLPGAGEEAARAIARAVDLPAIRVVPDSANPFRLSFDGVATCPVEDWPIGAADLAMIVPTSGTTGKPKLAACRHGCFGGQIPPGVDPLGLGPGDRSIVMTPLAHGHGHAAINRALRAGSLVIVPDAPDAGRLPSWMATHDPTWLYLTPHLLARLTASDAQRRFERNPALRFVRCGSAHLDPGLRKRAATALGVPIHNAYGSTEGCAIAMEGEVWPSCPGTVGRIVCPLRISVDGAPAAPSEAGEIELSGPALFAGYWGDPEATAQAFTPDGWYRTGDRGRVEDGYLVLLGRVDEIINSGGVKIDPVELDAAILALPAVRDAATYPIPHPSKGQAPAAAVVLEPDAAFDRRGMRRWLLERIDPRKTPVEFRVVEAIPRTAAGKVERWRLAEWHGART